MQTPIDPALLRRLERLQNLVQKSPLEAHAHLLVRSAGRSRDLLLGSHSAPSSKPPLLNWESAPLAGVFFESREGEEYELELGDRLLEGEVLERNLIRMERGELREVITERLRCSRAEGGWQIEERARLLRPREGERGPRQVKLDEAQQAIVDLPPRSAVLILGEAGAGKTTVAVHRIRRLLERNPRWRAGVIVPTEPLRHRIQSMLERFGVKGVRVFSFDSWALQEARLSFPGLPTRTSRHAPAGIVRIKRDPSLRVAMETLARRWPRGKRRITRNDLSELFGDRALIELAAEHADPLIPLPQIEELLEHTRLQFSETAEERFAGVEGEALVGVDGAGLDEGTTMADAGTLDPEDPPVLYALERLRAERAGEAPAGPRPFDVLFVDEAQELAPFELELLGRSCRRSLIVAGDAGQQVDPSANFRGWEVTAQDLGHPEIDRRELLIGYRCPPPIAAFANAIASGAPARQTDAVRFAPHSHDSHVVAWLVDELRALRLQDPAITVGVVVRDAARFSRLLDRAISVVGAEELVPGRTHVVSVEAAKGLEFDTVIVADASERAFPDTPASRRALYVAITRATHQLVLAWSGKATPLIEA